MNRSVNALSTVSTLIPLVAPLSPPTIKLAMTSVVPPLDMFTPMIRFVVPLDEAEPFFNSRVMSSPSPAVICPRLENVIRTPSKSALSVVILAY